MKNKKTLILEYAKLATCQVIQGGHTLKNRMSEIGNQLQMTPDAIMREATKLAVASLK